MITAALWRYLAAAAAGALLVAGLIAGANWVLQRAHDAGVAEGKKEVQEKWDAHQAQQTAELLAANLTNQESGLLIRKSIDRSRDEDVKIARARAAADAGLRDSVAGLLGDLAAGRAGGRDPAPAGGSPAARPLADGAAGVAGELLGECASRYAGLAEEVGRLAGQVIGLQGYVRAIQPAEP